MRFVLAIAAFFVAAVMIAFGIAQRTVLLEPSSVTLEVSTQDGDSYAVIDASALLAHPGAQTVRASGSGPVIMALGREADVTAWIGDEPFDTVRYDAKANELTTKAPGSTSTPTPTPTPTSESTTSPGSASPTPSAPAADAAAKAPADADPTANPAGSDLWLEEYTGTGSVSATMSIPEGYSLLVAGDGTTPAPSKITITWPLDNSTPWAGPLIVGGLILLLLGLVSYLLALLHLRRSRRPRRNMPKGPRMPRLPRAPKPKTIKAVTGNGGRRSIGRAPRIAVVPVVLVAGLALSGCSADYWPTFAPAPTTSASASATSEATPDPVADEDIKPPAVTVPQLERIVRKIAVLAGDADKNLDVDAIKTRFTGPALELRESNYKVRATLPDYAAPDAIPAAPVVVTAPQQTDAWPRVVMTVIQNQDDPTTKPTALVMTQASPRENYLVRYAVSLTADATVPGLAPAVIGSPIVAPDSEFLLLPPEQVSTAYADILLKGDKSEYYDLFDTENDPLIAQVGVAKKDERRAALPATASIDFTNSVGSGLTIALATNDSGAVVTANINETETVKPTDGGTVSPQNAAKAYSGVENSAKGVTQTYGDQILFYVPPAGSTEKIKLLGFSQGLISASEVP
ncbi:hypothetical protein [Leifsonia sp. Leaf264]|uniref:hypothetical protein n=1 Tax=Leifsonia sp. Leaf264 TaxID=1736314 RepID=UPI0006FC1500|nr:hypothetical protein [Leifsonia sp. Leaf264]KQP01280.1 hypothetical protein ASF30_01235 [Leifsonia sp. Leaf264]